MELNDIERSVIQVGSIAPKTWYEFYMSMFRQAEIYDKMYKSLDAERNKYKFPSNLQSQRALQQGDMGIVHENNE